MPTTEGHRIMSDSSLSRLRRAVACAKCGLYRCRSPDSHSKYPGSCPHEIYAEKRKLTVEEGWSQPESRAVFEASDDVLAEGYGKWCRVKEVVEYSKRMGYRKLGLAFCVSLRQEARNLQNILEADGFDVVSISCMAGAPIRNEVGFEEISGVGKTLCNPLMQAEVLNENGTELNIMAGLCVGHDILFIKHSKAGVTPLVVKDRVLQHNPVAALGTRSSRVRSLMLRARRFTRLPRHRRSAANIAIGDDAESKKARDRERNQPRQRQDVLSPIAADSGELKASD
jgi:uncharacterized metal-binding protein